MKILIIIVLVLLNMTSVAVAKNIPEYDEKSFETSLKNKLIRIEEDNISKNEKCTRILELFTLLINITIWIDCPKYEKLKLVIIDKCYLLVIHVRKCNVKVDNINRMIDITDKILQLCCCNKKTSKHIYCKKKKVGKYCTFHTNNKKSICTKIKETTYDYLNNDVTSIILDYVSP